MPQATWAPHRATAEAAHPPVPGVQLPQTGEVRHHQEGIGDFNLQSADIICVTCLSVNLNSDVNKISLDVRNILFRVVLSLHLSDAQ